MANSIKSEFDSLSDERRALVIFKVAEHDPSKKNMRELLELRERLAARLLHNPDVENEWKREAVEIIAGKDLAAEEVSGGIKLSEVEKQKALESRIDHILADPIRAAKRTTGWVYDQFGDLSEDMERFNASLSSRRQWLQRIGYGGLGLVGAAAAIKGLTSVAWKIPESTPPPPPPTWAQLPTEDKISQLIHNVNDACESRDGLTKLYDMFEEHPDLKDIINTPIQMDVTSYPMPHFDGLHYVSPLDAAVLQHVGPNTVNEGIQNQAIQMLLDNGAKPTRNTIIYIDLHNEYIGREYNIYPDELEAAPKYIADLNDFKEKFEAQLKHDVIRSSPENSKGRGR